MVGRGFERAGASAEERVRREKGMSCRVSFMMMVLEAVGVAEGGVVE